MGFIVKRENRWPGGVIPFEFDNSVPVDVREIIDTAMVRWQRKVNSGGGYYIRFKIRLHEPDYIHIMYGGAQTNANSTGLHTGSGTNGGRIEFKIGAQGGIASIPHELGHTIGLGHEHDREDSLLRPANFIAEAQNKKTMESQEPVGDYDIHSIMHYEKQFGWKWRDGHPPVAMNKPTEQEVRTSRWNPSDGDIQAVRTLYR